MISKLSEAGLRNRFIVLMIAAVLVIYGVYALKTTLVDAIPDLSENQVIIFTEWMGRRANSMFGMSFVFVIFDDNADIYWAGTRVLEKLNSAQRLLPTGVTLTLGTDGTGLGHVFWYTLNAPDYNLNN